MSRLERHHRLAPSAEARSSSVTSLQQRQMAKDPDTHASDDATAVTYTADDQLQLRAALSVKDQRKVSVVPNKTERQSFGHAQTADNLPGAISTVDLIKSLQRRNQEVLSFLRDNQRSAAV